MRLRGCKPDGGSFAALIAALQVGGQWQHTLQTLDRMQARLGRASAPPPPLAARLVFRTLLVLGGHSHTVLCVLMEHSSAHLTGTSCSLLRFIDGFKGTYHQYSLRAVYHMPRLSPTVLLNLAGSRVPRGRGAARRGAGVVDGRRRPPGAAEGDAAVPGHRPTGPAQVRIHSQGTAPSGGAVIYVFSSHLHTTAFVVRFS